MYRSGEPEHSHRKFYAWLGGIVIVILAGLFALGHFLKSDNHIGNTPAVVVTKISYDTTKLTTFDEKLFSIKLPIDWKPIVHNDVPAPTLGWQGSVGDNKNRWLEIYIDTNVGTFAVNRALHIQAHQNTINVLGSVSDNCTTFTGMSNTQGHGGVLAKWQGIDFLCDTGNYERDVVGTTSPDGLNNATLTGTSGPHHFFFVYTDNSASPDYSLFTNAIKSFRLK
jgi:hypothetical protein